MILILASLKDISVNAVMDWLIYYHNKKVIRIHDSDQIKNVCYSSYSTGKPSLSFEVNGEKVNLKDVTATWFRNGKLTFQNLWHLEQPSELNKRVQRYLFREEKRITEFLAYNLSRKKLIGQYLCPEPNKFKVLDYAKEIGLNIPDTFLMTSKSSIQEMINGNVEYIYKAASNPFYETVDNKMYFSFTEELIEGNLTNKNEEIFPTLIQQKIEKRYEIRTFYFNEKFYSAAIFSQESKDTAIDFRKSNSKIPNRIVPYCLPIEVEKQLRQLIDHLGYNTCSIDLIRALNDKYVFLEVNPNGQFGFISKPCNFKLEQKIASFLAK